MDVSDTSTWLRQQRTARGWSAGDLAQLVVEEAARVGVRLKLTQQAVSAFENNKLKSVPNWFEFAARAYERYGIPALGPGGQLEKYSLTQARETELQLVTLQVALPSESALTRMFEGLLRPLDRNMPVDELARILARRLPTGLSQLQDLRAAREKAASHADDEAPQAPAKVGRGSQPTQRT